MDKYFKWLPIIGLVVSIIVGYTTLQATAQNTKEKVVNLEREVNEQKSKSDKSEVCIQYMSSQLVKVDEKLDKLIDMQIRLPNPPR